MESMWGPTISCMGSIIAAIIGAVGSIWAARVALENRSDNKEKHEVKDPQINTPPLQTGIISETKQSSRKPKKPKKSTAVILGVSSVFAGIPILFTSAFGIGGDTLFIFPVIVSLSGIVLGFSAIFTGKIWLGIIGLFLDGISITPIIFLVIFWIFFI